MKRVSRFYNQAKVYSQSGIENTNLGNFDDALEDFKKADKTYKDFPDLNKLIAKVYFQRGIKKTESKLFDTALEDFKKADKTYKDFPDVNLYRAKCYLGQKDYKFALTFFKKSLEKESTNKEAFIGAAKCLFILDKIKKLEELCDKYIHLDSKNIDSYIYRGISRYLQNKKELAAKDFEKRYELVEEFSFCYYLGLFGDDIFSCKAEYQTGMDYDTNKEEFSLRQVKDGDDLNTKKRYQLRKQMEDIEKRYF